MGLVEWLKDFQDYETYQAVGFIENIGCFSCFLMITKKMLQRKWYQK
jgi:hypothetical protein